MRPVLQVRVNECAICCLSGHGKSYHIMGVIVVPVLILLHPALPMILFIPPGGRLILNIKSIPSVRDIAGFIHPRPKVLQLVIPYITLAAGRCNLREGILSLNLD